MHQCLVRYERLLTWHRQKRSLAVQVNEPALATIMTTERSILS